MAVPVERQLYDLVTTAQYVIRCVVITPTLIVVVAASATNTTYCAVQSINATVYKRGRTWTGGDFRPMMNKRELPHSGFVL